MYEELTASAFSASVAAISELRAGYAYAERYYLSDAVYFTAETVNGVVCVKLNSPLITTGDQILGDGTPGGGGSTGATYLWQLDDVNVPSVAGQIIDGQALVWDAATSKWTNRNITQGTVTRVDVGTTQYSPTDGVVSLPAYPTTLPASDVYAWAKASTKPSYALTEITGAADVQAIEALTGTSGLLRKTAANTWELDTNSYADMLKGLQAQIDSVASRDMYAELSATAFFADVAGVGSIIADNIELGGESLKSIPNSYLANHAITINGSSVNLGSSFNTASITAGTAGTSSATSGASFSIPYVTMNKYGIVTGYGVHTHSISQANIFGSSAVGSSALPVYYNGSALTACTKGDLFSALSSSAATNLSATVAGQTRSVTNLYATYDSASENISDKFGIVSAALQSLQRQIDSVASRTEDLSANGYFDVISVGRAIYGDVLITSGDQTLSDERRKNITREIVLTAEQIASCRAVAFDWKDKPGRSFGSIAQDWQKILPESVNDIDDTLYHFYGQSAEVAVINLAREVVELKKIIKRLTN